MLKVKTSPKGQIVIPKEIRDALGIKPGTVLSVHVEGRRIILEPSSTPPDIFVELGKKSEQILKESKRVDDGRLGRLLRDLGVESSG